MPKDKIVSETTFNKHPVIAGMNGNFQYSRRILKNNQEMLDCTLARHNKIYTCRMDVKLPCDYPTDSTNNTIKKFMSTYTKELSRDGLDPQYVVRREQVSSSHQHYHIHIVVNGSKRKDYRALIDTAVPHWGRALGVDEETANNMICRCDKTPQGKPQKNGIMIRRNSLLANEQYDQVYKQMSYLAKKTASDITEPGKKTVFYSQFRRSKSRSTK